MDCCAETNADRVDEMAPTKLMGRSQEIAIYTQFGEFRAAAYTVMVGLRQCEYMAFHMGAVPGASGRPVLTRVHSACVLGEVFGSARCDCAWQLVHAMRLIAAEGEGVLIYALGEQGRGAGAFAEMESYHLMDEKRLSTAAAFRQLGLDPDLRSFAGAALVLRDVGVRSVRLITNNPRKVRSLVSAAVDVSEIVPSIMPTRSPQLLTYLQSKRDDMGHLFPRELGCDHGTPGADREP